MAYIDVSPITAALHAHDDERMRATKIVADGRFEAAVEIMDDDLREEIHAVWSDKLDDFAFLLCYAACHRARFGTGFPPISGGEW